MFLLALDAAAPARSALPPINPRATELVESDPIGKAWALERFDTNRARRPTR